MERAELSFSLNASGTGVAQIIALLTAIMTVERAVIIIDEINNFLHPAAVKSLLRIIQTEYAQHQYIISTHSPEVISFSNPQTIHLVKREGYKSSISRLDLQKVDEFRELAEHLGVSMADVFAAEKVIWVEGATEELCFPFLYQQVDRLRQSRGHVFTSVAATGDFVTKKRDCQLVYEIYRILSGGAMPLHIPVAFSFDSENLTDNDKQGMVHDSRGAMHFLPRRHLECYAIHPAAIAALINAKHLPDRRQFDASEVESKLIEIASSQKFLIPEWNGRVQDDIWSSRVDAAKLISETCKELSEQCVTFSKKGDTFALIKYIQENDPNHLTQLVNYVGELVASL